MNRTAFLALIVALVAMVSADRALFREFKMLHNKNYASVAEEATRYAVFKENLEFINAFNADPSNTSTVSAASPFADLTNEEFRAQHLSPMNLNEQPTIESLEVEGQYNGQTKNWVKEGKVGAVLNQGQCGSCWSFSASEAITAAYSISTGNHPVAASPQNLMDCSVSYGNNGCNGGLMTAAFQYVIDNGGIDSLKSYPYLAQDSTCHYNVRDSVASISGMYNITSVNDIRQTVVNRGPVAIAIDASSMAFQLYSGGIFNYSGCSTTQLDHGVLLVGIDSPPGSDKNGYMVQNSWGTSWGSNGFIYFDMEAENGNMCGLATMATLPVV